MSVQNEQKNISTPSPTPSPSPPSRVRPVEKRPSPSPSPSPLPIDLKALEKGLLGFNWSELNRATEILRFFDDALIPFIKRSNVDAPVIAMLRIALATRLSEIILRKYQMTSTSFNLETAIDIIDEQLPKLIKTSESTINAEDILKMWNVLKDIIKRGGKK
jgi:hypothetical protein